MKTGVIAGGFKRSTVAAIGETRSLLIASAEMRDVIGAYSADYFEARTRFRQQARNLGWSLGNVPLLQRGDETEPPLSINIRIESMSITSEAFNSARSRVD